MIPFFLQHSFFRLWMEVKIPWRGTLLGMTPPLLFGLVPQKPARVPFCVFLRFLTAVIDFSGFFLLEGLALVTGAYRGFLFFLTVFGRYLLLPFQTLIFSGSFAISYSTPSPGFDKN